MVFCCDCFFVDWGNEHKPLALSHLGDGHIRYRTAKLNWECSRDGLLGREMILFVR